MNTYIQCLAYRRKHRSDVRRTMFIIYSNCWPFFLFRLLFSPFHCCVCVCVWFRFVLIREIMHEWCACEFTRVRNVYWMRHKRRPNSRRHSHEFNFHIFAYYMANLNVFSIAPNDSIRYIYFVRIDFSFYWTFFVVDCSWWIRQRWPSLQLNDLLCFSIDIIQSMAYKWLPPSFWLFFPARHRKNRGAKIKKERRRWPVRSGPFHRRWNKSNAKHFYLLFMRLSANVLRAPTVQIE